MRRIRPLGVVSAAASLLLVLGCAGCSERPDEAEAVKVVSKAHEPESVELKTVHKRISSQSNITVPVHMKIVDDEDYVLTVAYVDKGTGFNPPPKKIYATRELYEKVRVGDLLRLDPARMELEDPPLEIPHD